MNFANMGRNIVKVWMAYWDKFLITGLGYTLSLAAIAVIFGTVFGALIALMRMSKIKPLHWLTGAYTGIIRGTPMLLQLYLFYFALPQLIPILNRQQYACVAIALVCNSAAYVSEIIRSGIQAVDAGQAEAARSLGLSQRLTMTEIVLPQAVKNILPALGNEFIVLFKDTSLLSAIGGAELIYYAKAVGSKTFEVMFPYLGVAVIYLTAVLILTWLQGKLERRLRQSDRR